MKIHTKRAAVAILALMAAGCGATTKFVSTWKNPEVAPIPKAKGQTVIACVAVEDKYIRHDAEDALVAALNKRGQKGIPSYTLLPPGLKDEALAKAAFEKSGAKAVVVMRPIAADQQVSVSTTSVYAGPYYGGYWGGYYGYGWGRPYSATTVSTDTILIVETLFYSLEQNKLIWSGQSKTTNPSEVGSFVRELVEAAAWEMNKAKVFTK